MTKQTAPPLLRRKLGRTAVLSGATLVLSLSAAAGAHADDGGLLGGVTQVVGDATQPVVQPAAQAVQSAVPQPVQEAVEPVVEAVVEPVVEPVVEHVVEPAASHAEQTVGAVPGAGQAAHPAVKAVEQTVRRADEPGEQPAEEPAAQKVDPAVGSAQAPATSQAPVAGGPTSSHAVHGPGPGGAEPCAAAARRPPEEGQSGADRCTSVGDLPPRAMAVPAGLRHLGQPAGESAHQALWVVGDGARSVDVGSPDDGASGQRAFGLPDGGTTDLPTLGAPSAARVLGLLGLVALLGVLTVGLTVVLSQQLE